MRLVPSNTRKAEPRCRSVLIGAAENKHDERHILKRFLRRSEGDAGQVARIAAARRTITGEPRWTR